eukprot:8663801-Karenia_brevis.AAC.1
MAHHSQTCATLQSEQGIPLRGEKVRNCGSNGIGGGALLREWAEPDSNTCLVDNQKGIDSRGHQALA